MARGRPAGAARRRSRRSTRPRATPRPTTGRPGCSAFVDAAGGLETAGYCRTHHWRGGFANSAGQALAAERADVGLAGIARRDGSDGSARLASRRLADIDGAALGARAAAKANAAVDPIELPPDRYEVVLEPSAVADILEALSFYGFNAKAVAEQRSFVRVGDAAVRPVRSPCPTTPRHAGRARGMPTAPRRAACRSSTAGPRSG